MKRTRRPLTVLIVSLLLAACGNSGTDDTEGGAPSTTTEATPTSSDAGTATTTFEPTSTSTSDTGSSAGSSLDSPVAVGGVAEVGDWRVRVVGLTPDATEHVMAENEFNDPPPDGNQFFIATLEATHNGTESSTFWVDMSLKAVGETNVAYEAFEASCGVIPEDINNSGETFTGGTIAGNVCWNIQASDASSLVMIAEESFSLDETRAFFSLDPTATPLDESTATHTSGGEDRGPKTPIGETASVGSWSLKVTGVTPDATDDVLAENEFNDPPPEGNQFFIATLEATYNGDESSTFWVDMSLKAVGESNVAYEAFEATCGIIPNDIDDAGETFPGGTFTGQRLLEYRGLRRQLARDDR